jgi:lipopolysaccharide biosynthesis glycosyltransferase
MLMLNLVTTIDVDWLPYACMMLEGVRRVSREGVTCWILHENIGESACGKTQRWAADRGIDLKYVHFEDLKSDLKPPKKSTRASFYGRYLVGQYLPPQVTRCVYVDVDVLPLKPLDELMRIDLGAKTFGAVALPFPRAFEDSGVAPDAYFNNGLLVIDVARFPGDAYARQIEDVMARRKFAFGPQSAFNLVAKDDVILLDPIWNVQGETRARFERDAAIIHFTGDLKPWHYLSQDPLRQKVRDLIYATPFPEAWEPDRSIGKMAYKAQRAIRQFIRPLVAGDSHNG